MAVVASALLRFLLREAQRRAPRQVVPVTLATVVGALVAADLLRDDAGFVATTAMGMVFANQRAIDTSLMLDFQQTLVQLLVGVLFILIAASVSPDDVVDVLPEALALVAVMVLVIRPAAVALATRGAGLPLPERAFMAWMAPRGIVAGASASAFALQLTQQGVAGADKILPIVFVVIFGTVALYGLTAAPVARRLGVAGATAASRWSSAATTGRCASARRCSVRASASGCGRATPANARRRAPRASRPTADG